MRTNPYRILAALVLPLLSAVPVHPQALSDRAAMRMMEQATWGPDPAAAKKLQTQGFDAWFAEQVAAPVSTYVDQPILTADGKPNSNIVPVQAAFFQNALTGPDQLRQRVAFALSEIWVVSNVEIRSASAFPPFLRLLQADAFDNYEQLMKDVTLSPAMGRYLNMANNDKANPARGTTANENYARELMQLFTLGLSQLRPDGTPVIGANGTPVPAYTQADVSNLAKVFTGWTYAAPPGIVTRGHNGTYYLAPMIPLESLHDTTAKQILGATIPAGGTAEQDLDAALRIIFLHPNLPPFVCRQLIQHLVTSNPSPTYVARVAQVFENDGAGVRGNLQAVVRAILTDEEARAGDAPGATVSANYGHMREPVLLVANLLHGLGGTLTASNAAAASAAGLGQNLFNAPSVFSYFSPGYRAHNGLNAPELQIFSTQTASSRANLINSAVYGGQLDAGTHFDLSRYTAAATSANTLIELINTIFFHQAMSTDLRSAIGQALAPLTLPADKAKAALYVALTAGEYQVIH